MATAFNFSDRVYVPVGAPTLAGAIQSVQALKLQRATAEHQGRESYAAALARQRERMFAAQQAALARQMQARQRAAELAASLELARMQREAKAIEEAREAARLGALAQLKNAESDILGKYQYELDAVPKIVQAMHKEKQDQLAADQTNTIRVLNSMIGSEDVFDRLPELSNVIARAASLGVDRSILDQAIAELSAKAQKLGSIYHDAKSASDYANEMLVRELRSRIASVARSAAKEAGIGRPVGIDSLYPVGEAVSTLNKGEDTGNTAKAIARIGSVDKALELAALYLSPEEIDDAVKRVHNSLAARFSNDTLRYVRLVNGRFEPVVRAPVDADEVTKILRRALESVQQPAKPASIQQIYEDIEHARRMVDEKYKPVLGFLRQKQLELLYGTGLGPSRGGYQGVQYRPRVFTYTR